MKNNLAFYQGHEPFVSNIRSLEKISYVRNKPVLTSFLSPVERENLASFLMKGTFLYFQGGYPQAQRQVACISPFECVPEFDFECLASDYDSRFKKLSHSDVLGTLMHLGIERDFLGDLIVDSKRILIFCKKSLSDYLIQELQMIGRCPVFFQRLEDVEITEPAYEVLQINCASLRMDAVVAQLAHCSRGESIKKIHQGFVKLNDVVLEENRQLCNNDFVSIRRVGRFQFKEAVAKTRKNRLVLRFLKFK